MATAGFASSLGLATGTGVPAAFPASPKRASRTRRSVDIDRHYHL